MFDDLVAYYHENVVSAFLEYKERSNDGVAGRSRDLRGALTAATALFHLREHLPMSGSLSRAEVELACPDYAIVGDAVNAAKHKSLTGGTPHGAPLVSDAVNLVEQLVITEYEDETGPYQYAQKKVVVKLIDGSERNLLQILTNVIKFLGTSYADSRHPDAGESPTLQSFGSNRTLPSSKMIPFPPKI